MTTLNDLLNIQNAVTIALNNLSPQAPTQSSFKRLVFQETFSQFIPQPDGYTFQGDGGNLWINGMGFNGPTPGPSPILIQPNLLRLPGSCLITTQSRGWPSGSEAASRVFVSGYFEAIMRASGPNKPPNNWFSFWLFSALHQQISQSPPAEWAEIDINETGWWPKMGASTHDWEALNASPWQQERVDAGGNPPIANWQNYPGSPTPDLTQWHKYGCLRVPGNIGFYFDDVLVQSANTSGETILDTDPCSLVLSTNNNGTSQCDIMTVRVWQ